MLETGMLSFSPIFLSFQIFYIHTTHVLVIKHNHKMETYKSTTQSEMNISLRTLPVLMGSPHPLPEETRILNFVLLILLVKENKTKIFHHVVHSLALKYLLYIFLLSLLWRALSKWCQLCSFFQNLHFFFLNLTLYFQDPPMLCVAVVYSLLLLNNIPFWESQHIVLLLILVNCQLGCFSYFHLVYITFGTVWNI